MIRTLAGLLTLLVHGNEAYSQCGDWYRPYPVIVIAQPIPAAPRTATPQPARTAPKKKPTLKEESSPPPLIERMETKKDVEEKPIPKLKTPIPDPADFNDKPAAKKESKSDEPKKELKADELKKEPKAEEHKNFEQFVVPVDEKRSKPGPQVRVGFFNHSERAITLEVNGEQVKVPSEEFVTMRLPRTFKWSEKGGAVKEVVVPPDADGIEIVFRK